MKLWIWKHKGAYRDSNFYPLSKSETLSDYSIRPIAVHAFFRRKDAVRYMQSLNWGSGVEFYELISVDPKKQEEREK
jgi:hypothetical protein